MNDPLIIFVNFLNTMKSLGRTSLHFKIQKVTFYAFICYEPSSTTYTLVSGRKVRVENVYGSGLKTAILHKSPNHGYLCFLIHEPNIIDKYIIILVT